MLRMLAHLRLFTLAATAITIPAHAAEPAAPVETQDIIINFVAADDFPLEAKLTLPADRDGPVPVVFYLHGAGARSYDNPYRYTDADGAPHIGFYFDALSREFARRGIAFFRMSKRGCVALPEAPWMRFDQAVFKTATPSVLLSDYQAGLAALRERPEINATRIIFFGSSEGTRLAPQLALSSPDGVIGLVLQSYAADNAHDTIVWQNTVGPWRNIQHLIPAARDGTLTRAEFDDAVTATPSLAQSLPFDTFDADRNGEITADEMATIVRPRLDAILSAVEQEDDALLARLLGNLSAAYLREWWNAEPTSALLLKLNLPIAIFHGKLDGTCRVEGVQETQKALLDAGRGDVLVKLYPTSNHDLDWSHDAAMTGGPQAYKDTYDHIDAHFAIQAFVNKSAE